MFLDVHAVCDYLLLSVTVFQNCSGVDKKVVQTICLQYAVNLCQDMHTICPLIEAGSQIQVSK